MPFPKQNSFDFFSPNLPENRLWGLNLKNLSSNSTSTPPKSHVCQFSVKMEKFGFFGLHFEKLPNYMQYLGSNDVEDVTESWVEAEMS